MEQTSCQFLASEDGSQAGTTAPIVQQAAGGQRLYVFAVTHNDKQVAPLLSSCVFPCTDRPMMRCYLCKEARDFIGESFCMPTDCMTTGPCVCEQSD